MSALVFAKVFLLIEFFGTKKKSKNKKNMNIQVGLCTLKFKRIICWVNPPHVGFCQTKTEKRGGTQSLQASMIQKSPLPQTPRKISWLLRCQGRSTMNSIPYVGDVISYHHWKGIHIIHGYINHINLYIIWIDPCLSPYKTQGSKC